MNKSSIQPQMVSASLKISSLEEARILLAGLALIKDNKTVAYFDLKKKIEMIEKHYKDSPGYAKTIIKASTDKTNTLGINGRRNVRR